MADKEQLRKKLIDGLAPDLADIKDKQVDQLLTYLELMNHWNRKINLTAIHDPLEQVTRHLHDRFSIYSHLNNQDADPQKKRSVLDVGTGAGLPGIPLAIVQPDRQWYLLDSSTKRISFLRVVITQLKLNNVQLINSRVADHQSEALYPLIVCRAFASLKEITHNADHLLAADGVFLAMKGQYPEKEIAELTTGFAVTATHSLKVAGLNEERHLLEVKRRTSCENEKG